MKIFRNIMLILVNILLIPSCLLTTFGIIWYVLPMLATTSIGTFVLKYLSTTAIFWITIGSGIISVALLVVEKIFGKSLRARTKNFFTHLNTWLIALVSGGLAIATFVMVNPLIANEVIISIPKKIGIGIGLSALIVFNIFSSKLMTVINRKIQAFETAKEVGEVGRSSVILMNFLKLFEVLFPEMLVLLLISLCVDWSVASYFIVILISFAIPIIGNIECDFITRSEINKNKQAEKDALVQSISDNLRGE